MTNNSTSPRKNVSRLTDNRLRLIAIIATLFVAGIAIALRIDTPSVWTFLSLVITSVILGQQPK